MRLDNIFAKKNIPKSLTALSRALFAISVPYIVLSEIPSMNHFTR